MLRRSNSTSFISQRAPFAQKIAASRGGWPRDKPGYYGWPNIFVSIAVQSAHNNRMHGDAIDRMMTYSFWGLGLMISAGIALAVFIW